MAYTDGANELIGIRDKLSIQMPPIFDANIEIADAEALYIIGMRDRSEGARRDTKTRHRKSSMVENTTTEQDWNRGD